MAGPLELFQIEGFSVSLREPVIGYRLPPGQGRNLVQGLPAKGTLLCHYPNITTFNTLVFFWGFFPVQCLQCRTLGILSPP